MTYTELRLFKYRVLIIATLLILCSLVASCQITKVDNGFLISRDYAEYIAAREDCGERIAAIARPGDRIVVMGARDDTLTEFARAILKRLG